MNLQAEVDRIEAEKKVDEELIQEEMVKLEAEKSLNESMQKIER